MPKPYQNKSGCNDFTAFHATRPSDEATRVSTFVECVRLLAGLCGFEIINWIQIRVKKTGKVY